jgi:phosphoesterase RecJ-like protein
MQLFDITTTPTVIFDHHKSEATIQNATIFNDPTKAATSELLYECTQELEWEIPENAAKAMIYSILGDTLGLTSHGTTNSTIATFSSLVIDHNINLGQLDERRRELGKKPFSIFKYKQALMSRVEFHFDNQLATVDIPLEEIKEHSDLYNPAALFMEELRPVEGIRMAIAFKVYEDRITAKLREINDAPFCNRLAEHFGGGGHPFAAGFKVKRTDLAELKKEVLKQFYDLSEQA